jgi:hypothetical protein
MEILALAGISGNVAERANALATALSLSLYEARRHLAQGEPRVLATFAGRAPALAAADALRRAGFSPIVLDDAQSPDLRLVVRSFEFEERTIRASDRHGTRVRVPFSEIDVLVRGVRAAATTDEREPFLEVHSGAAPTLVFREGHLQYDGLHLEREPTAAANFVRLAGRLRDHAPHAPYDDRLNTRAAQLAVLGEVLTPEAHLEVATRLLAQALRRLRSAA